MKRISSTLRCFFAVLMICTGVGLLEAGGLDQAAPIGPYLDNQLPPQTPRSGTGSWNLVNAFPNLLLIDPIQMMPVPRSNMLMVAEQPGRVVVFPNDPGTNQRTQLLDISNQVQSIGDSGLLGIAVHPEFGDVSSPNRDYIYLYYRYTPDTSEHERAYLRLSRFEWRLGTGGIDRNSEFVLINQYDRHNWHNGGGMFFGADGFLYLAIGDEGGSDDQHNSAQRRDRGLFAGVMRIDVDRDANRSHAIRRQPRSAENPPAGWPGTYSQGYYIPDDNPWQNPDGSQLEEYWAMGTRSPHRMSVDPFTGRIWLGDVGQGAQEEISLVIKGSNLQWPYREGDLAGPKVKPDQLIGTDNPPIYSYGRGEGGCIIGGFVYRGSKNPDLVGKYIFGDLNNGVIRAMQYTPGQAPVFEHLGEIADRRLSSFGIDGNGEVYAIELGYTGSTGGILYRFERSGVSVPEPPAMLSETGAFSNLSNLTPRAGLMPYDMIQPLWSDGADKKRWIAIPNDGTPNSPEEKIKFSETESWIFPIGTVFVKHFEFAGRRLETRFFVKGSDEKYFGFTYKWRPDNSDADLLPGPPVEETIDVGGGQTIDWHFPGRTECFMCHTDGAGTVLGPKTRNLNSNLFYPETGRTDNQLNTLNDLGFFSPGFDGSQVSGFPTAANINDTSDSLERRARAYLDVNCSQCHQPEGPTQAVFDARFTTPPNFQNMTNVTPSNKLGLSAPKIIKPKNVPDSVLHLRMSSLDGCCAMPPLAKNAVDSDAVRVIAEWINSLDPAVSPTGFNGASPPTDFSVPSISLSIRGGGSDVSGSFIADLNASETILGLTASDFSTLNATITNVAGSGTAWTISVSPDSTGPGSISLASDKVIDNNGNANLALLSPLIFNSTGSGGGMETNLLSNSGFENGLQQWDRGGSTSPSGNARSGNGSALIGSSSYIVQSLPVTSGENYNFSGFYISDPLLSRLEAGATFFDANGVELLDEFEVLSPTSSFSPFSLQVSAPTGAASVAIYVLSFEGGETTVDDLKLVVVSEPGDSDDPVNILSNGGFDGGELDPWDIGSTNVNLTTDARTGTHAALLNQSSFVVHNMRAIAGQDYQFDGFYKSSGPGNNHSAGLIFWSNGGSILGEVEQSFPHSSSYTPFSLTGSAPPGTVSLSAWIYNGGVQTLKVDDLILELVSGPPNTSTSGEGNDPDTTTEARDGTRLFLASRDSSTTPVPAMEPVQPDLYIRGGRGSYRGNNEYGTGQSARIFSRGPRMKANFSIVWENDATGTSDGAQLRVSGPSRGIKTKYFAAGGVRSNLTGLIKTGQYQTVQSVPGSTETFLVKVRQFGLSRKTQFKNSLSATSLRDPSKGDTVEMKVIRRR